jgi:hypothetical protein
MVLVLYLYEARVTCSATQFKSVWYVTSLTSLDSREWNLRYKITKASYKSTSQKKTSFDYLVVFRKGLQLKYHYLSVDLIDISTFR